MKRIPLPRESFFPHPCGRVLSRAGYRFLQKKFGKAAESYQAILATLSVDELETLGERLITQSTLEDIFQGFPWSGSPPKLS